MGQAGSKAWQAIIVNLPHKSEQRLSDVGPLRGGGTHQAQINIVLMCLQSDTGMLRCVIARAGVLHVPQERLQPCCSAMSEPGTRTLHAH